MGCKPTRTKTITNASEIYDFGTPGRLNKSKVSANQLDSRQTMIYNQIKKNDDSLMQILKAEVREEIEKAALAEFLAKGFEGASMQNIARRAKISTSNIYNYFESKEKIFTAIATPVYSRLNQLLQGFMVYETGRSFRDGNFIQEFIQTVAKNTGLFIKENHLQLLLIVDKSRGTQYELFKEDLIKLLEGHFSDSLKGGKWNEGTSFIMHISATNLVEGLMEIVRHYRSDAWADQSVNNFIRYHICGLAQFFD
jgi:Transcriptional regulator